jgi:hypothetical protein
MKLVPGVPKQVGLKIAGNVKGISLGWHQVVTLSVNSVISNPEPQQYNRDDWMPLNYAREGKGARSSRMTTGECQEWVRLGGVRPTLEDRIS